MGSGASHHEYTECKKELRILKRRFVMYRRNSREIIDALEFDNTALAGELAEVYIKLRTPPDNTRTIDVKDDEIEQF